MLETQKLDTKLHNRQGFSCGVKELDSYLTKQSNQAHTKNLSRTYVLIDTDDPAKILGYYTLAYDTCSPPRQSRLYKKYLHDVPVMLLARLAVSVDSKGNRFGEQMLLDVIEKVAMSHDEALAPTIGLYVDAKNELAKNFYEKYNFHPVISESNETRLWLSIRECMDLADQT